MAGIPHCVQLHSGISQKQCQRARRLPVPPALACDGALPRRPQQSHSRRRRTRRVIRSHGLLLGGPSAVRVGLGGLAASNPSSGLSGLPLSHAISAIFANTGSERGFDDLDAPSREVVVFACAPRYSLREVPTGLFLPTHVPAILSPLSCSQSLLHRCQVQHKARTSANVPLPPSLPITHQGPRTEV